MLLHLEILPVAQRKLWPLLKNIPDYFRFSTIGHPTLKA